jgi:hypothetical protein
LVPDDPAKKWLFGRWAPAPEKTSDPAAAKTPKAKAGPKAKSKRSATPKAPEELPKFVIEFTRDGAIRLDGDPSALGPNFRFLKPLAEVADLRVAPEMRAIKITYEFKDARSIDVSADHSWLLEKLTAGAGPIPRERLKQLNAEYHPRETLTVSADPRTLTLTNAQGRSTAFRRYTGDTRAVEEGRRREAELRNGLAPLGEFMRQQGINTGAPPQGKGAAKK